MTDIFLRNVPSDANIADVRLWDPTYSSAAVNYVLAGETGSFAFTGYDATIIYVGTMAYTLAGETGAFAVAGQDAILVYHLHRTMSADPGAFSLTGNNATLIRQLHVVVAAETGVFSLVGYNATMIANTSEEFVMACGPGVFAITGAAILGGWFEGPIVYYIYPDNRVYTVPVEVGREVYVEGIREYAIQAEDRVLEVQ